MQISDFIQKVVESKANELEITIDSFIHSFKPNDDYDSIETQIENIDEKKFTSFGDKIVICIDYCNEKLEACKDLQNDDYVNSVKSFLGVLHKISEIVVLVGERHEAKIRTSKSTSEALDQNKDVMEALNRRIGALKKELNATVKDADNRIDSKIFTLLINTVAILGIFVAIAFAGFGVTSVFSNINLDKALLCKEFFIKSVFFLSLIALLSYNLLLLLVYFIFKLSRPILINIMVTQKLENGEILDINQHKFMKGISLKPFFWVSGLLFALTIILFVWCLRL